MDIKERLTKHNINILPKVIKVFILYKYDEKRIGKKNNRDGKNNRTITIYRIFFYIKLNSTNDIKRKIRLHKTTSGTVRKPSAIKEVFLLYNITSITVMPI